MKTIVEALKDLYVALGGKEEDVANLVLNPDVIEKIAAAAGDAIKPELPSLTGNAGKVLTVSDGATGVEWSTPSGGGGGGAVYYTLTNNAINASYNDLLADIAEGKTVFVVDTDGVNTSYMQAAFFTTDEDYQVCFIKLDIPSQSFKAFWMGSGTAADNLEKSI